jgi:hypothetical protein
MGLGVAGTAAAIGAAGAAVSAGASIYGSNKAAASAKSAANQQQQQYQTTRGDLQPYFQPGQDAVQNALTLAQSGPTGGGPDYVSQAAANIPPQMTQAQLEATPGYQFTLGQGLKATQSAAAAKGLGVSGAALKGAATYATGLADKTYLDQFNAAQQRFGDYLNLNTGQQGNLTNQFNRLNSVATLGANAAAGLGSQGTQAAANQGNYLNAAGIDQAQGVQGVGNAFASGANNYLAYNAYQQRTAAMPGYAAANPTIGGYTGTAVVPSADPYGRFTV